MGQMEVESAGFERLEENLNYSGRRLLQVFPGRNGINTPEEANAIAQGGPEAVANAIYGGEWGREHLGNTEPGDGWRFHGRGYVQLTGRENYTRAALELGINLIDNPELIAERDTAASIALQYWSDRVVANGHQLNVREATRGINGGYTHLPERRAAVARWEQALTPEVMMGLARGEALLPPAAGQRIGDATVLRVQQNLNILGIHDDRGHELVVDGNRGGPNSRTNQAIAAFQRQLGLEGQMSNAELLSATQAALNARRQANSEQTLPGVPLDPRPQQSAPTPQPWRTQTSSPAAPASLPPLSVSQTLEPGDRGAAVLALQAHLRVVGATDRDGNAIAPDRDYGPRTREAVEQFQLWTGRPTTGIADPDTLGALQEHARFAARQQAQGIAPGAHLADNLKPAAGDPADAAEVGTLQARTASQDPAALEQGRTVAVQAGLIQLGYQHRIGQPLNLNGVNDEATRQAVAVFQTERNLPVTGQIDSDSATQQALQLALDAREQAALAQVKERPGEPTRASPARTPDHPDHPDHALLEQLRGLVRGLDRQAGKGWDESSERLSASALLMARQRGFTDQDELQLAFNRPTDKHAAGELLHLARTGPHASVDPAADRAHMSAAEALSKPAPERYQQLQDIAQQQQELERRQALARSSEEPSRGGSVR